MSTHAYGEVKTSALGLIVHRIPAKYTYENMVSDINTLTKTYGQQIRCTALCSTADGRTVYDLTVGNLDSGNEIIMIGAMHAREYITTQVVMRQLCSCIDAVNGYGGTYKGVSVKELLQNTAFHFVPMSNPDGVTISQFGAGGLRSERLRNRVSSMTYDFEQWKANANGVDLNRNFDAGWYEYTGPAHPSSERYKGTAPGSESESAALIRLTDPSKVKRTISYHTCGALIYWYYKQTGQVLNSSRAFAKAIADETGYTLDSDYTAVDAAGYKDWAVYKLGIPSLTIEVGNEINWEVGNPVPIRYFDAIWQRNRNVPFATAYQLLIEQKQIPAPLTQSDLSFDYTGVFDFDYYINHYPDIRSAYGSDRTRVLKHFLTNGLKEGRVASPVFSIKYYMEKYPDLQAAFGNNYAKYARHFVKNGMKEMRQGNEAFDVYFYRYYYSDLQNVYGTNWKSYYLHYVKHGYAEHRYSYIDPAPYTAVFNMNDYVENNPDVYSVFGSNQKKLWVHFLKHGLQEGREASPAFSIRYYKNTYADLANTFGTHYKRYIDHFIGSGVREGRQSSPIFSVKIYRANYADLQELYGDDMIKYAEHFVSEGYKEGREAVKPVFESDENQTLE
ncbi:MAG: hypothetical protein IJU16_06970 [Clostridia bacterium]|nr:hypothetical protein [Clostridia bacterium]